MLTVGPNTSPSRLTTSPYATPPRTCGNRSSSSAPRSVARSATSAAALGSSATNRISSPIVLITRPAVLHDGAGHLVLEVLHPVDQLVVGEGLALPGVADDVDEHHGRAGGGADAAEAGLAEQPVGGAGEVPAPDVGLQLLDVRQHHVHQLREPLLRVVPFDRAPGEQADLPLGEPGEAAAPGADQGRLRVGRQDAEGDELLGALQRLEVGVGERHVPVPGVREAELLPELLGDLEGYAGAVGDLARGCTSGPSRAAPGRRPRPGRRGSSSVTRPTRLPPGAPGRCGRAPPGRRGPRRSAAGRRHW